MLCIPTLEVLIESLEANGYKVEYKNKVWNIDGKVIEESYLNKVYSKPLHRRYFDS